MKLLIFALLFCSSAEYFSSAAAAPRAAGNGLGSGLATTTNYVQRTASGAAGNSLGPTTKYLGRTRNGAAGDGLGTTAKYLRQTTAAGNHLATMIKYLRLKEPHAAPAPLAPPERLNP
jgi:hypothetical protein